MKEEYDSSAIGGIVMNIGSEGEMNEDRGSSVDKQWIRFYDEAYLRLYSPFLSSEKTEQDVSGILQLLKLPSGGGILDIGCSTGRHAISLAHKGYQVTGFDRSDMFLHQARSEAERQQIQVQWIQGDMRRIPFEDTFDAALSIFSSFGYFEREEENLQVLQQVHNVLRPGGIFLIDTLNQSRVLRSFTPQGITRYDDGLIVVEERRFDLLSSRYEVNVSMLFPNGSRAQYQHSMRIYTPMELTRLLKAANLQVQGYYGGLDGSPLTFDSRLVVVSQKKEK
jgi:SAM-dependent methyltransferase